MSFHVEKLIWIDIFICSVIILAKLNTLLIADAVRQLEFPVTIIYIFVTISNKTTRGIIYIFYNNYTFGNITRHEDCKSMFIL